MKVAEVIRFYSLDDIMKFIHNGGEYPLHHLWCYDQLKNRDITAKCIEYNKNSRWNSVGKKLRIQNLQQQFNLLKRSKEFDVVYAPFIEDVLVIAGLKRIGLFSKPILGIPMNRYAPTQKNKLKRWRQKILRKTYFKGIDSLLFINENLYRSSEKYGPISTKHSYLNAWGVDYAFFDSFLQKQINPPAQNFIYSTGGTGRDFGTLFEAFKKIDFALKVTTKSPLDQQLTRNLPSNIQIDNSIKPGLRSVGLIRKEYYNALAIAIPLTTDANFSPIGVTVLMEAMAMGKPIISTRNKNFPFDLEKEKIGLYVDYSDTEGWRKCINYLIENQKEAKEMGARAHFLAKTKYNYNLFSEEIISRLLQLGSSKKILRTSEAYKSAVTAE